MAKVRPVAETGRETVTVALKHPTGIVLDVFVGQKLSVPAGAGMMRDEVIFKATGQGYPVNGNRVPFGRSPEEFGFRVIGGFALTPGIPKDVWEKWLEQHQDHELVINGLITAYDSVEGAADFAQDADNRALRSGLEPLSIKDDPRVDKKRNREGKFVPAVEVTTE